MSLFIYSGLQRLKLLPMPARPVQQVVYALFPPPFKDLRIGLCHECPLTEVNLRVHLQAPCEISASLATPKAEPQLTSAETLRQQMVGSGHNRKIRVTGGLLGSRFSRTCDLIAPHDRMTANSYAAGQSNARKAVAVDSGSNTGIMSSRR